MINLQALSEKTIDFIWLDGTELHVTQPSIRFVNKVDRADNTIENCQKLAKEFLNDNREGRKFTDEEIAQLNSAQLTAILNSVLGFAYEVDNDPN